MKFSELFAFAKQETAQVFILASAAVWLFWRNAAPEYVVCIVGGLGALFIVGEKVRSSIRPK